MHENGGKLKLFENLLISRHQGIPVRIPQNVDYMFFRLLSIDNNSGIPSCICYLSFGTELYQFNTSFTHISEILKQNKNIHFINVSNDTQYYFQIQNCYNITFKSIDLATISINQKSYHFANSILSKLNYSDKPPDIQTLYWNLFAQSILPIFPNQTIEKVNFFGLGILKFLPHTSIHLGFDQDQKVVLIKKEYKQKTSYFLNEAQFVKKMRHPFLCNSISVDDEKFFIIYDYKSFESLNECKTRKIVFNEYQKFINLTRIIGVLSFIHRSNYIHGDVKPENILIDSQLLFYLCDFDFCQLIDSSERKVSNSKFQDPNQKETDVNTVQSIDIYSLGLLICYLYEETELGDFITKKIPALQRNGKLDSLNVPPFWAGIVNQCIQSDKHKRPTAESIEEICIPSQLRKGEEFCDIIETIDENSELFVQIGNYYFDGDQFDKAKYFFELAASLNQQEGFYRLGMWYKKIEKDYSKAKTYFELAQNHSMALYQLGKIYAKGKEININHQLALEFFTKSFQVDENNSKAMNWIGILYLQGHDISHNVNKALDCFRQASRLGNPKASNNITLVYQRNPHLFPTKKRNRSLSLKLFTRNKNPNVTSSRPRRTSNAMRWRNKQL